MTKDTISGITYYGKNGFQWSSNEKDLIKENIIRILNTRRGERINNPSFGCDAKFYLFFPEITINDLLGEISNSITRCEPRVNVLSCSVTGFKEEVLQIDLVLQIKSTGEIANLSTEV